MITPMMKCTVILIMTILQKNQRRIIIIFNDYFLSGILLAINVRYIIKFK